MKVSKEIPSPLKEEGEVKDQRLQEYLTRMRERSEELAPYLGKLDMGALLKLEESYQKELHDGMYAIRSGDEDALHEIHGWIKGAHSFLLWIENNRKRVVG